LAEHAGKPLTYQLLESTFGGFDDSFEAVPCGVSSGMLWSIPLDDPVPAGLENFLA
jgi:hypothetical protein